MWTNAEILLLSLCICAFFGSLACFLQSRQIYLALRRARDLTTDVAELADLLESQGASLKRLHSRAGMREIRERRAEESAPVPKKARRDGEDPGYPDYRTHPDEWLQYQQSQINKRRALGVVEKL